MRERSGPRRPSPWISFLARVGTLVLAVAALAACSGGSGGSGSGRTTPTTRRTTPTTRPAAGNTTPTYASSAVTAFFKALAALRATTPLTIPPGGCPASRGPTVVLTVTDSGLDTRCITMTVTQSLDIRNTGATFHNVTIADLSANVDADEVQPYGRIGHYLAPATYGISSSTDLGAAFSGVLVVTPS
jgi:hypothetical protein